MNVTLTLLNRLKSSERSREVASLERESSSCNCLRDLELCSVPQILIQLTTSKNFLKSYEKADVGEHFLSTLCHLREGVLAEGDRYRVLKSRKIIVEELISATKHPDIR